MEVGREQWAREKEREGREYIGWWRGLGGIASDARIAEIACLCEQLILAQNQDCSECGMGPLESGSPSRNLAGRRMKRGRMGREGETFGDLLAGKGHPTEW